jgi:hypothetical protein
MIYLDRRFVKPSPEDVDEAVHTGAAAVPREFVSWPPVNLSGALAGVWSVEHGAVLWQPQGYGYRTFLRLAWAIDHRGRRLVRVTAGADLADDREFSINSPFARWPPLALVHREVAVVFQREDRLDSEVLLACPCGALGTPEDIGWMDDRCGPCHDRTQDGVPLPEPFQRQARCFLGGSSAVFGRPQAISPDGREVVVASTVFWRAPILGRGQYAAVVAVASGRVRQGLSLGAVLQGACFSADGRRLAVLSERASDARLDVLSYPGLRPVLGLDLPGKPCCLTLSPDGRTVHVGTGNLPLRRIHLDEADTEGTFLPVPGSLRPDALAASPDGAWLAAHTQSGTLKLLDALNLTVRATTTGLVPQGQIVFTPDSRSLWGVEPDGTLWLRGVPSLRPLGRFQALGPPATGLAVAPPWLVVFAQGDQPTQFWPLQPLLDFVARLP